MTNKRQNDAWQQSNDLRNAGYNIQGRRCVRLHKGKETLHHRMSKMACAHVLSRKGYRVDSEVELTDGPIADILAYGLEDRKPIVVEFESKCTQSLRMKNVEKYVTGIVSECFTIDVEELPDDIRGMANRIEEELFGR